MIDAGVFAAKTGKCGEPASLKMDEKLHIIIAFERDGFKCVLIYEAYECHSTGPEKKNIADVSRETS